MGVVRASELDTASFRREQIQAVEDGNPFRRIGLVAQLIATRLRLRAKSRRPLDIGLEAEERPREQGIRTFWLVQGYMLLLFVLDLAGGLVLFALGGWVAYAALLYLGGTNAATASWVQGLPFLGAVMGRVSNLTAWVPWLLGLLDAGLRASGLAGGLAKAVSAGPFRVAVPVFGYVLGWGLIRGLRQSVVRSLKAVL